MENRQAILQNKGMRRDVSISKENNEYAYENFNIRIEAREHETLLSVTNERGNTPISIAAITVDVEEQTGGWLFDSNVYDGEMKVMGTVIGYNVLNNYLTVFTTEKTAGDVHEETEQDHIYRIEYFPDTEREWRGICLFSGDLAFDITKPIETLGDYESDDVMKVYWLDGINQPRLINIADRYLKEYGISERTKFDFVASFSPTMQVSVEKIYEGSALFSSGTIQYVFTYSNKYGQQSNIVQISPMMYASPYDRGSNPDETVNCQFRITLSDLDNDWMCVNIYRIMQTSESGQYTADRIARLNISSETDGTATYIDDGSGTESTDATELLYVGGREISAYTFAQKDNTLFLGNLKLLNAEQDEKIKEFFDDNRNQDGRSDLLSFSYADDEHNIPFVAETGYYPYINQLNYSSDVIRTFKAGEKYRIGIRFITSTGSRSSVYWVGDVDQTLYPHFDLSEPNIKKACLHCVLPEGLTSYLLSNGYMQSELMMAERTSTDRSVQAQGFIVPTVFNYEQRINDTPFALSSWYARPRDGEADSMIVNRHFSPLPKNDSFNCEIQCCNDDALPYGSTDDDSSTYTDKVAELYANRDNSTSEKKHAYLKIYYLRYDNETEKYVVAQTIFSKTYTSNRKKILAERVYNKLLEENFGEFTTVDELTNFFQEFNTGHKWSWSKTTGTPRWFYEFRENMDEHIIPSYEELRTDIAIHVGAISSDMGRRYVNNHKNCFAVDESICTFHTPELYDGNEKLFENANYKLRIIGLAAISSNITDYNIDVSSYASNSSEMIYYNLSTVNKSDSPQGLVTFPLFNTTAFNAKLGSPDEKDSLSETVMYIYPWHKTGSISNRRQGDNESYSEGEMLDGEGDSLDVLKTKTESNMRFCLYTNYLWADKPWSPSGGMYPLKVFDSEEDVSKQFQTPYGDKIYQANYDFLLSCRQNNDYDNDGRIEYEASDDDGYHVYDTNNLSGTNDIPTIYSSADGELNEYGQSNTKNFLSHKSTFNLFYDPVNLSVKSTKHILCSFKRNGSDIVFLPNVWDKEYTHEEIDEGDLDGDVILTPESEPDDDGETPSLYLPWSYDTTDVDKYYEEGHVNTLLLNYYNGTVTTYPYFTGELDEEGNLTFAMQQDDWERVRAQLPDPDEIKDTDIAYIFSDDELHLKVFLLNGYEVIEPDPDPDPEPDPEPAPEPTETERLTIVLRGTETDTSYLTNGSYQYIWDGSKLTPLSVSGFSYSDDHLVASLDDINGAQYFFIAELYNDFDSEGSVDNRYGGITEYAVQSNTFIPLGNITTITKGEQTLTAYAGDTYFQRWDCQKTYQYSEDKENNINEFVSVMLETYRNIEGRHDIYRGFIKNTAVSPSNSNLYNDAYNNLGTLFQSYVIDSKYSLTDYPAQVTWTLAKTPTSETDTWTNITLASTLDMDGDKGSVTAIRRIGDSLISFQEKGIAQIAFNNRTQLSTAQGLPVELANSGRVEGKTYVTDKNGCSNKWSIAIGRGGIWFADSINKSLCRIAQQIEDVSNAKGFKVLVHNASSLEIWNPYSFGNFVTYYDTVHSDAYFLNSMLGDRYDTLCFNESINEFTSFYMFGKVTMLTCLGNRLLSFKQDGKESVLWLQNEGTFSNIFGEYQDYYVTYKCVPDPYSDKTFTNLQYRADIFDMTEEDEYSPYDGKLTDKTFDTLEVWDEHQGNTVDITFDTLKDIYPDVRRKFRVWRMDIPRDRVHDDNPFGLNRMRNPWLMLRLCKRASESEQQTDERMVMHDLIVSYFD